jgi:flagella basal body P-ring formation protein FlgA
MTRKHVVATRDLPEGTTIVPGDVALKRTASAAFLQEAGEVIGRRLTRAVRADEPIASDALEAAR